MQYQKYIDLGFKRTVQNDTVEFKQTGYYGFILSKELNDRISIEVHSTELNKPKLYIKKRDKDTYHIIELTGEMVVDIFTNTVVVPNHDFTNAC